MKKILSFALVSLAVCASAMAQIAPIAAASGIGGQQSLVALDTVSVKPPPGDVRHPKITFGSLDASGVSFGYLSDGKKGMGAVSFGLLNNFAPKFSLNAMTVVDTAGSKLYEGLNISWRGYDRNGLSASLIVGAQGAKLGSGGILTDAGHILVGFQITRKF